MTDPEYKENRVERKRKAREEKLERKLKRQKEAEARIEKEEVDRALLEANAEKLYTNVYACDGKQKKKPKKAHFKKAVDSELGKSLDRSHPNFGHYGQDTARELKTVEAWKEKIGKKGRANFEFNHDQSRQVVALKFNPESHFFWAVTTKMTGRQPYETTTYQNGCGKTFIQCL